jgi:hypothetical protein
MTLEVSASSDGTPDDPRGTDQLVGGGERGHHEVSPTHPISPDGVDRPGLGPASSPVRAGSGGDSPVGPTDETVGADPSRRR